MMEQNSCLRKIGGLANKEFFVPSYRRGYRWGKREVATPTPYKQEEHQRVLNYGFICIAKSGGVRGQGRKNQAAKSRGVMGGCPSGARV